MKNKTNLLIVLLIGFMSTISFAQVQKMNRAKVGNNTTSIDASAALEAQSTTQGFLPPRMTTAQRNAISNPATGLVVYNTTVNCLEFFDGAGWFNICTGTNSVFPSSYTVTTTLLAGNHINSTVFPYFYDGLKTYAAQDVPVGNMQTLRLHQNQEDIVQAKFNTAILVGGKIRISWSRTEWPCCVGFVIEFKNGSTTSQPTINTLTGPTTNSSTTSNGNDMTLLINLVSLTDTVIIKSHEDNDGLDPILLEIEVLDNNNNVIPLNN